MYGLGKLIIKNCLIRLILFSCDIKQGKMVWQVVRKLFMIITQKILDDIVLFGSK